MAIPLKDFVRTALVEISQGVSDAAEDSAFQIGKSGVDTKDAVLPFQKVDFEILVTVEKSLSGKGAADGSAEMKAPFIGVVEGSFDVEGQAERRAAETHKIRFSVPIWFNKPTNNAGEA